MGLSTRSPFLGSCGLQQGQPKSESSSCCVGGSKDSAGKGRLDQVVEDGPRAPGLLLCWKMIAQMCQVPERMKNKRKNSHRVPSLMPSTDRYEFRELCQDCILWKI
ncbi:hypothetical protein AV530_011874 [Patagioenas fasciata monilis]|uniref:Uncharacterized protein n=1 Tax=Patagioenas fasciata monilis TaxID=372326 RepID=A0A1V4JU00_PATFA|nr:hypothetical protein AV530_011874 [Patagioenas fasciata monilis]